MKAVSLLLVLAGVSAMAHGDPLDEATRWREQGRIDLAAEALAAIDPGSVGSPQREARFQRESALLARGRGDATAAQAHGEAALAAARAAGDEALIAGILNDLGLLAAERGDVVGASGLFDSALETAVNNRQRTVIAVNRARLALDRGNQAAWESSIDLAWSAINSPGLDDVEDAYDCLSVGATIVDGQKKFGLDASWRLWAFHAFSIAERLAMESGDARAESWAVGYLAGLYEDEGRHAEALARSRRAIFLAQSVSADDALYRWQWQAARAARALGDIEGASVAYREAIATLERLRPDLAQASRLGFRERAAPVFFDYADMLLAHTATLQDPPAVEASLREVRSMLERAKVAEVRDYFEDQCMAAQGEVTDLDRVGDTAAVVYPILLPDRTELLVGLPSGLRQFTVPVSVAELTVEVRAFREGIERYDGRKDYLVQARRLYDWLIGPFAPALEAAGIDTLVIVPDGPLRTIPLSSLHDGERFLVERFALATTPGLTLTSPQPLQRGEVQLLAGGLTESVQGFSALPNVAAELDSVSAEFPSRTLRNEAFLVEAVQRQVAEGDQAIVHIATHGQFDSDHSQSFLLAWDDKLTMDRLQDTIATRRYRDEPLELLVLSACQTAAGDDRAALGLAGVALKAGARSALATLWFVNDESTARMVTDFYRYLGDPSNTKAEALRLAQLALIQDRRFAHPSYWAPFLLIGNWL